MPYSQFTLQDIREPKLHLWTIEEYYRMAEIGVFENKRVELIEGKVLEMSPMEHRHAVAVGLVADTLRAVINSDYHIREQMPFTIDAYSEPEPDVAVIRGQRRDYLASHPQQATLIIEVSDSTLVYDRTIKQSLYARVGIPEYWILSLVDNQLEVYRNPQADEQGNYVYSYNFNVGITANEPVQALAFEHLIKTCDLIP